jgi:hypothetical protein
VKLSIRSICRPLPGALALLLAAGAFAHHSTAMYDMQRMVKLTGVVKQFDWTNPHTFIWLDVQEEGKTVEYAVEGMSPNYLSRNGWTRHTLQAGETIGMEIRPLKDGRKGGFCAIVTLPDGTRLRNLPGPPLQGAPANAGSAPNGASAPYGASGPQ